MRTWGMWVSWPSCWNVDSPILQDGLPSPGISPSDPTEEQEQEETHGPAVYPPSGDTSSYMHETKIVGSVA